MALMDGPYVDNIHNILHLLTFPRRVENNESGSFRQLRGHFYDSHSSCIRKLGKHASFAALHPYGHNQQT